MGLWEAFLQFLPSFLNVLRGPSFTLIYPLYVSIRTVETGSSLKNQQCLTYWVLFALITMVELTLGEVLKWFPFWPYAKGFAIILLVTPYFGGASYVFEHLVEPYFIKQIRNIRFFPNKKGIALEAQNGIVDDADTSRLKNGPKLDELSANQGKFGCSSDIGDMTCSWSIHPKRFQKEWSCVLCLISTSSEECLKKHLRGRKHKTKEDELRADKPALKVNCELSSMPKKAQRVVFLGKLNLERWNGLINPVTRSIRWCNWKKPENGCIKLNTDGSVDLENAGFGGLLRDYKGDPLCAYVSKAPENDIFLVELWAIWRGLVLASGLGIKVIWVESDSLSVVKTINRQQVFGSKSSGCLKQIWKLLSKFDSHRVTHSWRETNKAADHLSRMILKEHDVVLWPADFPDILHNIIKDDAQGKIYFRSVKF
ncbi:TB2/DP1/HVA22-related protein [Corchorus olitorius]|uniref:TB2/DP1/HVA22-related protein n=1 Tax=Corchorus olitorius TaxID=93759 RepID=A0A1R3GHS8_9ROSI|nr:TB2/DP1/HVA22-related protein [Corchorus olitorius]